MILLMSFEIVFALCAERAAGVEADEGSVVV